jgi:hypothetical protein
MLPDGVGAPQWMKRAKLYGKPACRPGGGYSPPALPLRRSKVFLTNRPDWERIHCQ